MDLSVIIVCYKGWEKLNKCLEALAAFDPESFNMEVIVIDNNSGDGKINDLEEKFSRFRFIKAKINGGYAYGCNLGAASASGDVYMILNPDTIVKEEAVGKLLRYSIAHPEYYIISCRQIGGNGKERKSAGKFPGISKRKFKKRNPEASFSFPDWVSGSLMMIRKETFLSLHGFDESFWMYYEDVDICLRARNEGGEIAFCNDIEIKHYHGGSSRINLNTASITKSEVQVSKHIYIQKHLIGFMRIIYHAMVISDNLITGLITGVLGLILFFIPQLLVRILILIRLIIYYSGSLYRRSWISPRSVKSRTSSLL
jgi:GT2 family glycosyltransferase